MSWQEYVDGHLVGTGNCTKAAIVGLDGSTWATTVGFNLKAGEGKKAVGFFADASGALQSGVHLNGEKYMTIRADNRSIYGKKGATGYCAVKTNQCILLGIYNESIQPGQCANTVEKLADYLIENGY